MMVTNTDYQDQKKLKVLIAVCLGLAIILAIVSSLQVVRSALQQSPQRKILAKILAEKDGRIYTILKIKTEDSIDIEIYNRDEKTYDSILKQRFTFANEGESFIMIKSEPVNLGIVDINNDGHLDLIAPTVDQMGHSRLNMFSYDSDLAQFSPVQE